jgi:uncharacterized membrane protein YbhN (UPF0104 family)
VDKLLFLTASFLFAGWIGILSLFAPGGLGVREGVLLLALKLVLPAAVAAVIVLAARLWTTAGELICVGIVFLLDRVRPAPPGNAADLPAGDER